MSVHKVSGLDSLIDRASEALCGPGWICLPMPFGSDLATALASEAVRYRESQQLVPAGVGRGANAVVRTDIRSDRIAWLDGSSSAQQDYLAHMEALRHGLNRALFAGLREYECHFSDYAPGAFYERHIDSFRGDAIRKVSTVFYLNPDWQDGWGGQLRIFDPKAPERVLAEVSPQLGSWVCFLSDVFEHEVLTASHHRHAIAGWFRCKPLDSPV